MGKALRNKELTMIVFCQFYCHMLAVCGRALADVYGDIKYSTFYAAHEFALGVWGSLEVKAAHDTITAHRLIVLAEVDLVAKDGGHFLVKLALAEALEEVAAGIAEEAWLDDEHALYVCWYYIHCMFIYMWFSEYGLIYLMMCVWVCIRQKP